MFLESVRVESIASCARPNRQRAQAGFTLIEMMIVVACIAILAAIVLPSYQNSIRKARRTDAKAALTMVAQLMERYSTEHATYVGASLGSGGADLYQAVTENGFYNLSLSNLTATTFTVNAAATGGQTNDSCTLYSVDQAGVRTSSPGLVTSCW